MCLACEIDALWFAQMEAACGTPGTAGTPPALKDDSAYLTPRSLESAGETPPPRHPPAQAGEGGVGAFRCEETRSQ
jgi:hypothetical protein